MWKLGTFVTRLIMWLLVLLVFVSGNRAEAPSNTSWPSPEPDNRVGEIPALTGMDEPLKLFVSGFGILTIAAALKLRLQRKTQLESYDLEPSDAEEVVFSGRGDTWETGDREAPQSIARSFGEKNC